VGVAVNVTDVPLQMVDAVADMETLAGTDGVTVIMIELDVAGFPVAQTALEISWHVTTSPFDNPEVV
jgi:hypothetical protein